MRIWDQNGTKNTRDDDVEIDKLRTDNLLQALRAQADSSNPLKQKLELDGQGTLTFTLAFEPSEPNVKAVDEEKEDETVGQEHASSKTNTVSLESCCCGNPTVLLAFHTMHMGKNSQVKLTLPLRAT